MKKLNLFNESLILLLMVLVYFFTVKSVVPKYVTIFLFLVVSFYFFPFKLLQNREANSKNVIFSNLLISVTLIMGIIGFYYEQKFIFELFAFINFAFMIYYAFRNTENKPLSMYYRIITNHFLLLFLLAMVIW